MGVQVPDNKISCLVWEYTRAARVLPIQAHGQHSTLCDLRFV